MKKITVSEVADQLGIDVTTLREGAKQDKFPFMTAFRKEGGTNYIYVVFPQKVKEYIG